MRIKEIVAMSVHTCIKMYDSQDANFIKHKVTAR